VCVSVREGDEDRESVDVCEREGWRERERERKCVCVCERACSCSTGDEGPDREKGAPDDGVRSAGRSSTWRQSEGVSVRG